MSMKKLEHWLQSLWHFIYDKMVTPCRLPMPADVDSEQLKINVLRIVLGAVLCWRTALITYSAYYYFPGHGFLGCPAEFWFSLLCLALAICLVLGTFTPLVTLAMLGLYNQMDAALSTMTLGTNILTLCLFFLLFTNAGSRLSVDERILNNPKSPLHSITSFLYRLMGFPSRDQIRGYCW